MKRLVELIEKRKRIGKTRSHKKGGNYNDTIEYMKMNIEKEYRKGTLGRMIENTEEVLKEAADTIEDLSAKLVAANMERSKKNTESKCHNCFGAANNDCRFCEDDGK